MECPTCNKEGTLINKVLTVCSNPDCRWYKLTVVSGAAQGHKQASPNTSNTSNKVKNGAIRK